MFEECRRVGMLFSFPAMAKVVPLSLMSLIRATSVKEATEDGGLSSLQAVAMKQRRLNSLMVR